MNYYHPENRGGMDWLSNGSKVKIRSVSLRQLCSSTT